MANAGQVIRQGDSVVRPSNPNSTSIDAFLPALRDRFRSTTAAARDPERRAGTTEFIDGDVRSRRIPIGRNRTGRPSVYCPLMLEFHRASALVAADLQTWSDELADPQWRPIVCHNDVCMENVVFRNGVAIGLLDFDFAAPRSTALRPGSVCPYVRPDRRRSDRADRLGWHITDYSAPTPACLQTPTGSAAKGRHDLVECLDRSMNRRRRFCPTQESRQATRTSFAC